MTEQDSNLTAPPVRRAKHLIDPANPERYRPRNDRGLTRVQQWVMSALVVTTLQHLVVGLVIAAVTIDEDRPDARIGLMVIAAIFGVGSLVAGFAIHKKNPVTPWALLGVVPSVVGAVIAFG